MNLQELDSPKTCYSTSYNSHARFTAAETLCQCRLKGINLANNYRYYNALLDGNWETSWDWWMRPAPFQARLPQLDRQRGMTPQKLNRRFSALISKGNIHAAISIITEYGMGGVLKLTPVLCVLPSKASIPYIAQPKDPDSLLQGELLKVSSIILRHTRCSYG